MIAVALGTFLLSQVVAQRQTRQPSGVMTERGIHVEEVRVGGNCVVVMSRGGPSDHIAVVPVRGALESGVSREGSHPPRLCGVTTAPLTR